jgi:2-amino-4-hydroxy-6-hydroxymethyldihydropteridine diphosphokinase
MSHTVYIALGTNLGDRQANLTQAREALPPAVRVTQASPVYETEPWGYTDQPRFLNQAIQAETNLAPKELLAYLKRLESNLGRTPTFHYGPRLIDLDILLYDDLQIETPNLTIPHPHLSERPFVLVPLADLASERCIPGLGKSVKELLAGVDVSEVKKL